MEADRKDNVQDVFQRIYTHLGAELYRKLFPVILTDNGASFKDPAIFERPEGELLSRVFYCDPMASWQMLIEKVNATLRSFCSQTQT